MTRSVFPVFLIIGAYALGVVPYRDFTVDDTFIHLQFAKNLLNGHGFSFNPSEPTYGSTSPLWVFLLWAAGHLSPDLFVDAKVLGWLFGVGAVVAFYLLSRRLIGTPAIAFAAGIAFALGFWFRKFSSIGMEASLAVFLLVLAVYLDSRERREKWALPLSTLVLALGVLVRPEFVVALALSLLAQLLAGQPGALRRFLAGCGFSAVILGPWLAYAYVTFGTVVPNTVVIKALEPGFASSRAMAIETAKVLGSSDAISILLLALGLLVFVAREGPSRAVSSVAEHLLPLGWLVGLPLGYIVRAAPVNGRYLLPALPVLVLYAFLSLDYLLRQGSFASLRLAGKGSWPQKGAEDKSSRYGPLLPIGVWATVLVTVAVLAENALASYIVDYPWNANYMDLVKNTEVYTGKWLLENTPPGASIAAYDIGAIGYYSNRKVVDTVGLANPDVIPFNRQNRLADYLQRTLPDYIILSEPTKGEMAKALIRAKYEAVYSHEHQGIRWANPEPYTVTLYRVYWNNQ